jgi:hypothetical protein
MIDQVRNVAQLIDAGSGFDVDAEIAGGARRFHDRPHRSVYVARTDF